MDASVFTTARPQREYGKLGTKRMLGVHNDVLPGELGRKMTDFGTEAFGDFRVCPFTKEKSGAMQFVCIESAKNVRYKRLQHY
jgi:hypothetical protein